MSFRLLRNYVKNKKYILLKNQKEVYFTIYPFLADIPFFWIKSYFLKKNFKFSLSGKIFYMFKVPSLAFFLTYKNNVVFDQQRLVFSLSFDLFKIYKSLFFFWFYRSFFSFFFNR